MLSPTEVLSSILKNPTDIEHVRSLVAPDVTYVSLNYDNPDLKKIMPWAGTSRGPESIVKTFVDVNRYWKVQSFEPRRCLAPRRMLRCSAVSLTSRLSCLMS